VEFDVFEMGPDFAAYMVFVPIHLGALREVKNSSSALSKASFCLHIISIFLGQNTFLDLLYYFLCLFLCEKRCSGNNFLDNK